MKRSAPTSAPSSPTKRLNLACGSPSEPTDETYIYKNSAYGSDIPSVYAAPGYPDYLNLILTARVYDVASETPLQPAHNLSLRIKNNIYLKREDLQPVFSFKLRGAYNRMQQLSEEEKKRGVIACSAGNHAQGVALSATKMGIKATIVMPLATPPIKWRNVKRLGAEVVLFGNDFDEAKTEAARLQQERGLTNIPPYDDPYVIAGQGTIGVELLRQASFGNIDAIFVCVGGGGLAAGVASYIKRLNPSIKIIGVETLDAAGMTTSILAKKRVTLPQVGLFADGAAVRLVGEETFRICEQLLDEMILVSTDEICAAIKDVFEDTRSVLEPAGALSVAGAKKYIQAHGCEGKNFITICSGANMNFDRLRFVAERADLGENKEALISVVIPEQPGSFLTLHSVIHPRSVTEFSYRYGDAHEAHIFMSFVVNDRDAELKQIFAELQALGMRAMDASHNELAKAHARYLVGGRKEVPHERIFRFSFPERPGALNHFLNSVKCPLWNISLFHYRNYGGDVGKVVVGLQVPPDSQADFETFLGELKYPYVEETNNKVYRLTLNAGFAN
ncbi:tryptophan synthase beta subunit-like PLP-dependent enzyme [Polychytrium aggregatum]|uniref:tryptophan synthase beta subunit-like PLP-dependent enzyme n=1 Tax=Polychytrium aggregatum TaxID=110093 RepID=UPI0022FED557|nr:tryptophan synthase beta subunit-like PLP-dependent enzyme [Polychytrium aggregatum]KAI9205616.1 tryptophan synthase beta subunit-like PLP-dependent enzyme [Polychytrium aggregatum]